MERLPYPEKSDPAALLDWAKKLVAALSRPPVDSTFKLQEKTLALLPSASLVGRSTVLLVVDATGGPTPAWSDGTDWRRFDDGTVVS